MGTGYDFLAGKDEAYRRAWLEAVETIRRVMDGSCNRAEFQSPGYGAGVRIGLKMRPGPMA